MATSTKVVVISSVTDSGTGNGTDKVSDKVKSVCITDLGATDIVIPNSKNYVLVIDFDLELDD